MSRKLRCELGAGDVCAAYFPSGAPPAVTADGDAGDEPLAFTAFRRAGATAAARSATLLRGRSEDVDYEGGTAGAAPPPCAYALGCVDAGRGTLTLFPLAGGAVLRLDARVRGLEYAAPESEAPPADAAAKAAARKRLDESASLTAPPRTEPSRLTPARRDQPSPPPSGTGSRRGWRRRAWWLPRRFPRRRRCRRRWRRL